MILVIGATGQLGAATAGKLTRRGMRVRALVRPGSQFQGLERQGVEIAFGDLLDPQSLDLACAGVEAVIATATAHIPSRPVDNFKVTDGVGYRNVINACVRQQIRQFTYVSGSASPLDDLIPLCRLKRMTERYLRDSGLVYTIFRCALFMDIHFALLGSDLPLVGAESPTLERGFRFTQRHFGSIRHNISERHKALVPGDGRARHSFICVDDVSEFLVRSIGLPLAYNSTFDIGGPESLSWNDVVDLYRSVLGIEIRAKHTPALIFRLLSNVLRSFSPAAANIMALNYLAATTDTVVDNMDWTSTLFGIELTPASVFLASRASRLAMAAKVHTAP